MKLKLSYEKREDVPDGYEELYDEVDGKFVLTGVEGMKTDADITRLQTSLTNERKEHKATKAKLTAYDGLDPDEVRTKLDTIEELEAKVAASTGKTDDAAIERLVESRVKRVLAPVERERDTLKAKLAETGQEVETLKTTNKKDRIDRAVSKVAADMKVVSHAIDDVSLLASTVFEVSEDGEVVTKELPGLTPGLTPALWMKDMQEKRPHWWAASVGGGANGSGLPKGQANPWSAKSWNLTEQGKVIREHGADKANQLAKQAGVVVGASRPAAEA